MPITQLTKPDVDSHSAETEDVCVASAISTDPRSSRPLEAGAVGGGGGVPAGSMADPTIFMWDCRRRPAGGVAANLGASPGGWPADSIDSGEPCPRCGSLAKWWDIMGGEHCQQCEGALLDRGLRLIARAAAIRKMKPVGRSTGGAGQKPSVTRKRGRHGR